MIIVAKSIAHIDSLVDYVFKSEKEAFILESDGLDTASKKTILEDLKSWTSPRLKNQYLSMVISPEENLNNEEMTKVVLDTLQAFNLNDHQFLAVVHDNTEHKHVHVLVNRTSYDLTNYNDSYIGIRAIEISREIAKKNKLAAAYDKRGAKSEKATIKDSPYHQAQDSSISEIRALLNEIIYKSTTVEVDDIFDHLKANGVGVSIERHKNGTIGVTLEHNGQKIKASQASRLITLLPDGEGFKANPKLAPILVKNFERLHKKRTDKDIIKDIAENPQNYNELYAELTRYTEAMRAEIIESKKPQYEESDIYYKKKKIKRYGKNVINW